MSEPSGMLGGISFKHWFTGWIAVSAAALIGSIAAHERDFALIAVGSLLFGFGQWVNHPVQTGIGHGYITTGYPRSSKPFGLLLEGLGLLVIAIGIYRAALHG